jgi:hypothetical protein
VTDAKPAPTFSRTASVRRTVVLLVVIVLCIYAGFIMSGVFGHAGQVTP